MPSVHRQPGSPYWFAFFTGADGKRIKRSTKQRDRRKAQGVCNVWAKAAQQGREDSLTEAQSRKFLSEVMEIRTGRPLVFYTVREWIDVWTAGKEQTKSNGTANRYRQVCREFLAHLGKRAELNLTHIVPKDLLSFRESELTSGKSGRTCNLAVKIIGGAFNAARRQGIIPTNPAEALEALPHQAREKDVFTLDQITRLLAAASPEWRGAILFGFYTGARLLDVATMPWKCVDLDGSVVRFVPRKTRKSGKAVTIPLHSNLLDHLRSLQCGEDGCAAIFPELARKASKGSGGEHGLSSTFKRIMVAADVSGTVVTGKRGKGRAGSSLSFHSLRHSFNSAMANAGVAQEVRQKLTGHASAEMNKIYTHHDVEALRAAIQTIPPVSPAP